MSFINKHLGVRPSYRLLKLESDLYKTMQAAVATAPQELMLNGFYLTKVNLSSDGKIAKIFFLLKDTGSLPLLTQPAMLARWQKATHFIVIALKTKMRLRIMPQLTFIYDREYAAEMRALQLLDNL